VINLGTNCIVIELKMSSYLINGRKMFHMALMNLVGWTRYNALRFFLYL